MINLNDKVIWITGGTRGIGIETAINLLDTNCKLVLSSSSENSISRAKETIKSTDNILFIKCDVASDEDVSSAYNAIKEKFGKVDCLVNNAGIFKSNSLVKSTMDEFDEMLNINLKGAYRCIKSVLPDMLEATNGSIINVLSVVARKAFYGSALYSASKAGLMALSGSLREEVKKSGIKVINIFPGAIATEIWEPKSLEKFSSLMMKPEEVGKVMADTIIQALTTSVAVEEIVLRPITGDL